MPGEAQIFASASVLIVSDSFDAVAPVHATSAEFENEPALAASTVIVIAADVCPGLSGPMLHVTGPVPPHPVCDTNVVPAGTVSVTVTLVTAAVP